MPKLAFWKSFKVDNDSFDTFLISVKASSYSLTMLITCLNVPINLYGFKNVAVQYINNYFDLAYNSLNRLKNLPLN